MKRPRYQFGTLYQEPRKNGPDVWVYRWREADANGKRQLRKQIVGTIRELRSRTDAQQAVEALRLSVNRQTVEHCSQPASFEMLVEHYRLKELPMDTHERKTRGTKLVYNSNLNCHIVPRWGRYPLRRINSVEVEDWLKSLKLAQSTKAKLRNVMSAIFRHAIRWGWLGQQENPIALVRVSAKRKRIPAVLTAEEFRALFAKLPDRERTMGAVCATTGLRISEVLGLKWEDIDFGQKTANVQRSFVDGSVGNCKSEISQQEVPVDGIALDELAVWRSICLYSKADDWVFGSERVFGRLPIWPDSSRSKVLQPAARKAGITKRIGWHTFRHTYSSLLSESANDVKVVQELMRHAKVSTTMDVYTHARMERKRAAQSKVVDVLFSRKSETEATA
jgi:integrase